jgi:hypothetical protein
MEDEGSLFVCPAWFNNLLGVGALACRCAENQRFWEKGGVSVEEEYHPQPPRPALLARIAQGSISDRC